MRFLAIDDWVKGLAAIPEAEFTDARIGAFITQYGVDPESLTTYAFYANHYTRNLIYKCDLFEVLAVCWDVGQASPPHDHAGQKCWTIAPVGRLRVRNFRVEGRDAGKRTCRLISLQSFDLDLGHPDQVDAEEPVHQVMNLAEFEERAISIHVYSRPYASCEVYDAVRGTYRTEDLTYWSEYGKVLSAAGEAR
jgi:cysteine dioxygenase